MSIIDLDDLESLFDRANAMKGLDGGKPYIMVPNGHTVENMEKYLPAPLRINRIMNVQTVEALIEYYNKWSKPESELFACLSSVGISGIIDAPTPERPSWCEHVVKYSCPYSRQWTAWKQIDGHRMNQIEFAEFLEDHVADVVVPVGGELLELCTDLQIHRKSVFGSSTRLATGEHSISFSEENTSGTVEIPKSLELALPVFERGTAYKVQARFKYRVREGDLMLWVELIDPDKYVEDAFNDIVEMITEAADCEPLRVTVLPR